VRVPGALSSNFRVSGALRLSLLLDLSCNQGCKAQQVVRGAAENEDPVDLNEAAQVHFSQPVSLSQPMAFSTSQRRLSERA